MVNFSIIIPHKNSPDLLNRCLDSIPSREDVEVIIIDDDSIDEKRPVITASNVRLILLDKSQSKGAGHARNVGMHNASGKWLLFADCDDYYESNFVDVLDNYIDSEADIVYFDANMYNKPEGMSAIFEEYETSQHLLEDRRRLGLSSNTPWNKMFRRSFIINNQIEFEEIPISNDAWFVNYAGFLADSVVILHSRLYYYVDNPSGITKSKRPVKHYFQAMKSNSKRNKLKMKNGDYDLIDIPGFNTTIVLRDYGAPVYLCFFLYKLFSDYSIICSAFIKIVKKVF